MSASAPVVASVGINWLFLYEVEYEDDCIVILRDLGRFHRWDEEQSWQGPAISAQVEIFGDYIHSRNHPPRLVEIRT